MEAGTGSKADDVTYMELGFRFTDNDQSGLSFGFGNYQTGNSFFPGSTALYLNDRGASPILTQVGGGEFSLQGVSLAPFTTLALDQTFTFTGTRPGGGTVTQSFTIPAPSGGTVRETAFTFTVPGFNDVTSVTFPIQPVDNNNLRGYQFDNVVVGTPLPVPEPGTVALLAVGAGVGAFGAVRRRVRDSRC